MTSLLFSKTIWFKFCLVFSVPGFVRSVVSLGPPEKLINFKTGHFNTSNRHLMAEILAFPYLGGYFASNAIILRDILLTFIFKRNINLL